MSYQRLTMVGLALCLLACPDDKKTKKDTNDTVVTGDTCAVDGGACAVGEQCCEAGVFGLGADMCVPSNAACPLGCDDGVSSCALFSFCQFEAPTESYACVETCATGEVCGYNHCCPMGSLCVDGACALADLTVDVDSLSASVSVIGKTADACEIEEQCVGGPGDRMLLQFGLKTPNIGDGHLYLGTPEDSSLFEFSSCHEHYHFTGYAAMRLLNQDMTLAADGKKASFALMDIDPVDENATSYGFDGDVQGISSGWADVYAAGTPCQWIDVTDLAPGSYKLEVVINPDKTLAESDYTNNSALVDVEWQPDSCPGGCAWPDATVCNGEEPEGLAGDGICQCAGRLAWDSVDCNSCFGAEPWCRYLFEEFNSCPWGCTAADAPDCATASGDGVCGCGGTQFDDSDCVTCMTISPECAPYTTCPDGCTAPDDPELAGCCDSIDAADACEIWGNGTCDCPESGLDFFECAYCISDDDDCPSSK